MPLFFGLIGVSARVVDAKSSGGVAGVAVGLEDTDHGSVGGFEFALKVEAGVVHHDVHPVTERRHYRPHGVADSGNVCLGAYAHALEVKEQQASVTVTVEVRLFNCIARYAGRSGWRRRLEVPVGTAVGEIAERLGIPFERLFLVLVNGRDITPGLVGDRVNGGHQVEEGDVIAFSGAVPYSYGYGSPVV